jgi:hypothetical protein
MPAHLLAERLETLQTNTSPLQTSRPCQASNTTYWGSCSLRQIVPRVLHHLSCYGVLLLARLAGSAHHTAKFRKDASPTVLTSRHYARDQEIEQLGLDRFAHLQDTALVRPNKTLVARHIGGKNSGQPTFEASCGQGGAPQPRRPITSSAFGRHSNHEGKTWHSPFAKRPIVSHAEGD